jgi:hypothetical protein
MKILLQYLASWYWERMRRWERRAAYHLQTLDEAFGNTCRRKALRLKDKAERLERWVRWWE